MPVYCIYTKMKQLWTAGINIYPTFDHLIVVRYKRYNIPINNGLAIIFSSIQNSVKKSLNFKLNGPETRVVCNPTLTLNQFVCSKPEQKFEHVGDLMRKQLATL